MAPGCTRHTLRSAHLLLSPGSGAQILSTALLLSSSFQRGWGGLRPAEGYEINSIYTRNRKEHPPYFQPPTEKEIQGLTKLMRSQKTEVIQVQCANRGTGDTEKKQNRTQGPKRFQLLLLSFLLPVDWGWGALSARNSVPLSEPGLGSPVQLSSPPPAQPATLTPGQGVPFSKKGIHILPLNDESLHGFLLLGTESGVVGICVGLFGGTVYT